MTARNEIARTVIIVALTILVLVVTVPALLAQATQKAHLRRNHPPSIQSFTSSKGVVALCPFSPGGACSSSGTIVTLEVKASDRDNDNLTYKYSVSAGTIAGSGATVNWDLSESRLGIQTASVEVTDQRGVKATRTTTVDIVVCGACDPPRPFLSVTCPTSVTEGEIAVFVVSVSGTDSNQKLTYLWRHSNGKVVGAKDEAKISIRAVGSPDDIIAATVRVLGLDPSVSRESTCESKIEKRIP